MVANTRHRLALKSGPLSRNDAVELGSATVPVAPVGVPPTRPRRSHPSPNGAFILRGGVFGGTPKRAGETPRAPNRTASFRPSGERSRAWPQILGFFRQKSISQSTPFVASIDDMRLKMVRL